MEFIPKGRVREIGFPIRVIVKSMKEFLHLVNKNIINNNIYVTVYSFLPLSDEITGIDYSTAFVDCLFFDLDGESCHEDIKKFHNHLLENDILHRINFSGGGFHCFIYTNTNNLKNKKEAVYNAQVDFIKKLNLHVDRQILGDVARLRRVENTWNFKRGRYCIPLTSEDLKLSFEEIRRKAKKQQFKWTVFGHKRVSLKKYDNNGVVNMRLSRQTFDLSELKDLETSVKVDIPPCVKALLNKKAPDYPHYDLERPMVILWLRDMGVPLIDTIKILKKRLSNVPHNGHVNKFQHVVFEEKQPQRLYSNKGMFFPKCETIERAGLCPGQCQWKDKLYYSGGKIEV